MFSYKFSYKNNFPLIYSQTVTIMNFSLKM